MSYVKFGRKSHEFFLLISKMKKVNEYSVSFGKNFSKKKLNFTGIGTM